MIQKTLLTLLVLLFFVACPKKETNNNTRNAIILLALANSNTSASQLSTTQQQSTSISAAVSGAARSATSAVGGSTGSQPSASSTPLSLYNEIQENGKDPYFIREKMKGMHQKMSQSSKVDPLKPNLTAITGATTGTSTASGVTTYTYTFAGDLDGQKAKVINYDWGKYIPSIGSCTATYLGIDSANKQGKATFTNGTGKWSSTTSSSTSSYKGEMNTTVAFADYGTMWFDDYSYYKYLKDALGGVSSSTGSTITSFTCDDIKKAFSIIYSLWNHSRFTATGVTAGYVYDFSSTFSSTGSTYKGSSTSTTKFSNMTMIATKLVNGAAVETPSTIGNTDIKYEYIFDSSFTISGTTYKYGGTYTFKITGTIDGKSINDTLEVKY
ncbi:MAG: hypothetical protein SFU98_15555 [Leptospiraceae bacterium]|nr:hypothetical protein [Leptospiraceae bacterium]